MAAALLGASLWVLLRLPGPTGQPANQRGEGLRSFLGPLQNRGFRQVALANMTWSFASMFINGFAAVYQIQVLGIDFFQVMLWTTAGNLCRSLCTPLMAKLAVPLGWKRLVALCIAWMAGVAVLWSLAIQANALLLYPMLSVLGAVPYAALGVGFLQLQVQNSPAQGRSIYFSVIATLNGVGGLVGSMLCSGLIGLLMAVNGGALQPVFWVGCASALLATGLVLWVPANTPVAAGTAGN